MISSFVILKFVIITITCSPRKRWIIREGRNPSYRIF